MALKTILVALTTRREIEGKMTRVRFPAKSVVDLTDDEQATMDSLERVTGKLHTRKPIMEGGKAAESKPQVVDTGSNDAFAGAKVPMDEKSVKQLQAYLTFNNVEFAPSANKAALLQLATSHATVTGEPEKEAEDDPDAGL